MAIIYGFTGLLTYYVALLGMVAVYHRRATGRRLLADVRHHWRELAAGVVLSLPLLASGGYWLVTGKSALTLMGW